MLRAAERRLRELRQQRRQADLDSADALFLWGSAVTLYTVNQEKARLDCEIAALEGTIEEEKGET